MPIGSGIVYNTGDLILSQVSSSGTAFLETKIASATSSIIYFDSTARINSASLNSITVGTASYVSGSRSIITNLTASNISASGTGSFGIVGIGTVNPAYKLDVNGNANFTNGFYTNTDASSTSYFVGANGTRPIIFQNNTATSYDFGFKFSDSNTFTLVGGNTLANPTTDLVSFTYDGNLGIGTTSPLTKLQVKNGSITAGTADSTNGTTILLGQYSSGNLTVLGSEYSSGGPFLGYGVSPSTASAASFFSSTPINIVRSAYIQDGGTHRWYLGPTQSGSIGTVANLSEVMRIASDGSVGIGTTNPTSKLHIVTTGTNDGIILDGSTNPIFIHRTSGSDRTYLATITNAGSFFTDANAYDFVIRSQTSNILLGRGSGASTMAIVGSNVGIGTSSPAQKLEVQSGSVLLRGDGSALFGTYYASAGENTFFTLHSGSGNTFHIGNDVAGTNYNTIVLTAATDSTGGKVGIGTTNPVAKLQVNGNISGSSFTSSVSNDVGFLGTSSWAQNVVTASYLVPTNSYTITNLTASGVVKASQIAEKVVTFTPLTGSITGAPAWYRIISGSGILDSGRVRMSANYDNSRSDIEFTYAVRNYDTDGAGAFINITRASTYNSLFNAVRVIETGNLAEPYAIDVLIGNYLNNTTPGSITCLYESQFIGAVLDTPTFVSASATGSNIVKTVYTTYTSGYPRIGPTYSDGLAVATVQGQLSVGYRGNYAYNTPSTLNYALLVSGSVGIGTSSPSYKLDVSGSIRSAEGEIIATGNNASFRIYRTSGINYFDWASGQNLYLGTVTSEGGAGRSNKMVILDSGYVGIGTSSPGFKLDVYTPGNNYARLNSGASGSVLIINGANSDAEIVWQANSSYRWAMGMNVGDGTENLNIYNYTTATINLHINKTSGFVGIGTTSPGALLDVSYGDYQSAGTIRIGADLGANTSRTNTSRKWGLITGYNYTNASAAIPIIGYDSNNTYTAIHIGGGTSSIPASPTYISFYTTSSLSTYGTERVRIDSTGNVGIGTTNPVSKLHTYSSGSSQMFNQIQLVNYGTANLGDIVGIGFAAGETTQYGVKGSIGFVRTANYGRGAITFYTNNTAGTEDVSTSNERMRIAADGNVGIGTTNPSTLLQLKGDAASHQIFSINRSGSTTPAVYIGNDSSNNALIASNNTNLRFGKDFTGTFNEYVRIDTSGNVGIGTTSVNHKLDMWGATGTTFNMANVDDSGRGGKLTFISSSAAGRQFYVGTNSSIYNLVFGIDSIEKMRLDINGNLGIGTTSPAYLLDVSGSSRHGYRTSDTHFFTGSVNISGSLNATASWATNALTASFLPVGTYNITSSWANNVVSASYATTAQTANALNTGNSYTIAGLTNNGTLSQQGTLSMGSGYQILATTGTTSNPGIAFVGDTNTGIYSSGADTIGLVTGGSEKVTINSTGNVGIGTTSPGAKLDVVGGINSSTANNFNITSGPYNAVFYNNSTSSTDYNAIRIYQGASGSAVGYFGTGGSATGNVSFRNTFVVGTQNSNDFVLNTTDTERVRITSGGNVGIGTTTPNAKLDVNGNIIVTGSLTTTSTIVARNYIMATDTLYIQKGVGGYQSYITAEQTAASTGNSFKFWNSGTGTLMTIGYNGYVGIGTTSPTYQLHVNGGPTEVGGQVVAAFEKQSSTDGKIATFVNTTGSGYTSYIYIGSNPGRDWKIGKNVLNSGTTGHFQITNDLNQLRMQISAADDSITFPSSSVGIGTTNATDKLTVYGAMASYKTGADTVQTQVYLANGGNTRAFNLQLNSGGTGLDLWSYNSANAWLKHTTFDYDGRVGIGTAAPAAKLEISGSSNSALLHVKSPISGAILYVSGSGAVGINTSTVGAYTLQVNGSFAATTKSFVIQHPDPSKSDKQLVHGVLEGPEHSVFVRGILKDTNIIQLPDYWQHLVHEDSVSVTLTSNKYYQQLYVKNVTLTTIEVGSETDKPINCYYYIVGERKDIDKLIPEI